MQFARIWFSLLDVFLFRCLGFYLLVFFLVFTLCVLFVGFVVCFCCLLVLWFAI